MAMKEDIIDIEILPDGTIKATTPKISAANHQSADQFMVELGRLAGGATKVTRRSGHTHTHAHDHAHEESKG